MLFPLITSVYVARVLLEDGSGRVAYAQNMASYFVAFASMGISDYGLREIAKVRDCEEKRNQVFTQLFVMNLVLTFLSLACYLMCIVFAKGALGEVKLLLICGLSIVFNAINVDWFYRGNEEYKFIVLRSLFWKFLLTVAILAFVNDTADYMIYALILCLATGGNYLFNIFHLRNKVRFDFSHFHIRKHFPPLLMITLCALLGSLYNKADITMLGVMDTDASVGYYFYAHRTIDVIITTCISITSAFLPRLSYYYQNDKTRFFHLLDTGVRILAFLAIPACFGVTLLAPEIIQLLYGSNFAPSAIAVRIFSILIIVKSFGDLLCYQLVLCTGNERKRIPAYLLAAITNIVLNFFLIPLYAFVGAAIASVASEMVVNGYQLMVMKREISFSIDKKAVAQALFSSAIMSGAVYFCNQAPIPLLGRCIFSITGGCAVYGIINLLMKNQILLSILDRWKRLLKSMK